MNKRLAGVALFVLSNLMTLPGQTKPENILSPRVRIYEPKYLKRERAEQVARFVHSVHSAVTIYWEPLVNGLVLTNVSNSNLSDALDKSEELIKRFDVPEPPPPSERQVEMTVSLIHAYTDAGRVKGNIPAELADVVKQMKGALPYGGFSLVDTIQVKVRDQLRLEDALPPSVSDLVAANIVAAMPYFYSLDFHDPSISSDGRTVSIRGFRFGVKVPVSTGTGLVYQEESISTPLTIYDGQKQVLGKVKIRPTSGDDLFVVLSCKVK
ncbi:MAG TPA: hypothetical protein VKU19_42660 [Bryobacteraceae bacterium]|nr:hypothetical protein [Bryobacteraceae bacterium]